jgi:hypothetical protein
LKGFTLLKTYEDFENLFQQVKKQKKQILRGKVSLELNLKDFSKINEFHPQTEETLHYIVLVEMDI